MKNKMMLIGMMLFSMNSYANLPTGNRTLSKSETFYLIDGGQDELKDPTCIPKRILDDNRALFAMGCVLTDVTVELKDNGYYNVTPNLDCPFEPSFVAMASCKLK